MSLATSDNRRNVIADGVTTSWTFAFKTYDTADIRIYFDAVEQLTGFTVTLNADQDSSPGGQVDFDTAPDNLVAVTIQRYLNQLQSVSYPSGGSFPSITHEKALDEVYMILQQLQDASNRAIKAAVTQDSAIEYSLPTPAAHEFVRWNAAETGLENFNVLDLSVYPVSSYMQTMLGKTTAAEVNTYLGQSTYFQTLIAAATSAAFRALIGAVSPTEVDAVTITERNIKGLVLAQGVDTDNDLNVTAGFAADDTLAYILTLAASRTKQLDAPFAEGDAAGGLLPPAISAGENYTITAGSPDIIVAASGTPFATAAVGDRLIVLGTTSNNGVYNITVVTSSTQLSLDNGLMTTEGPVAATLYLIKASQTYYIHLMQKDSDGSCEIGFDDNSSCTNIPAGYTYSRLLGEFSTDTVALIDAKYIISYIADLESTLGGVSGYGPRVAPEALQNFVDGSYWMPIAHISQTSYGDYIQSGNITTTLSKKLSLIMSRGGKITVRTYLTANSGYILTGQVFINGVAYSGTYATTSGGNRSDEFTNIDVNKNDTVEFWFKQQSGTNQGNGRMGIKYGNNAYESLQCEDGYPSTTF